MPISFKSPEIDLKNYNNDEFLKKFNKHEHIVVRNTFDKRFIQELNKTAENFYIDLDEKFKKKKIPKHEIDQYFGNFQNTRFICFNKKKIMNDMYEIIKNSNLSDLFFNYFSGNFFISENENCIRRADGSTILRSTGLHKDGQLSLISKQGINSKDELTVWTPLVDCSKNNVPRLLLLDKNIDKLEPLFESRDYFKDDDKKYLAIQLKPFAYTDEKFFKNREKVINNTYKKLFKRANCFAPYVPLGSSIIFSKRVWHGTFITPEMKTKRYSMDFRVCGDFKRTKENNFFHGVHFLKNNNQIKNNFVIKMSRGFYTDKNRINLFLNKNTLLFLLNNFINYFFNNKKN